MIRTVKKMIGDRLRHCKTKTWVEVLKPSLNRYNNQIHGSTKTTPNNAHNLDNVIQVRTNLILKEKHNRKYPNISEGDYVKIFDKGKGNYVSRKETRSQWSERKYKVILAGRDMMNNRCSIINWMEWVKDIIGMNYYWLISNCSSFFCFGLSLVLGINSIFLSLASFSLCLPHCFSVFFSILKFFSLYLSLFF